MKIVRVECRKEAVKLTKPYTIAYKTISAVDLFFVEVVTDAGLVGRGSASPSNEVTGESPDTCAAALERGGELLSGRDPRRLGGNCRVLREALREAPGALAALDMALYDLFGKIVDTPVVEILGRCHEALPTSVTLGIQTVEESLADADVFLADGFRSLKVKIGRDYEADVELLSRLREHVGCDVSIRVDGNQGYHAAQARRLWMLAERLDLELIEQPLPVGDDSRSLPAALRRLIAADESLLDEHDALALAREPAACGIFNIKLMKCGGITPALRIGALAETAGIELMWGCNDESRASIAAALHAAFACPNTRYIDLDGSFDLASDPIGGGFVVEDGLLRTRDAPGLGFTIND